MSDTPDSGVAYVITGAQQSTKHDNATYMPIMNANSSKFEFTKLQST
jgi:hypothetical protein